MIGRILAAAVTALALTACGSTAASQPSPSLSPALVLELHEYQCKAAALQELAKDIGPDGKLIGKTPEPAVCKTLTLAEREQIAAQLLKELP